jgi:BON domain
MRWISLLLGVAAVAAAARFAIARSRAANSAPLPPVPPRPQAPVATPPAPPVAANEPPPAPPVANEPPPAPVAANEPPAAPAVADEPPAPAAPRDEPPRSAVSPAAETVREVADDLLAAPTEGPDDQTVERELEAHLAESPVAGEAEVTVEVHDRIASLEGTVPDPETAMAIADEAAHVKGVQGLDNRLRPEREAAAEPEEGRD